MFSNIIIDDGFLVTALIEQGIREKYVSVIDPTNYTKEKANRISNRERDKALEILVLFNKAHLPILLWDDITFDLQGLIKEGLIELLYEGYDERYIATIKGISKDNYVLQTLRYLRPLIRSQLYRVMQAIEVFVDIEKIHKQIRKEPFSYYHRRKFADHFYDFMECGMNISKMKLKRNISDAHFRAWISTRDIKDDITPYIIANYVTIACYLFDQSSANQWPIISEFFGSRAKLLDNIELPDLLFSARDSLKAYRLFKIVIKDMDGFKPIVRSIEDVLRLRDNKRIRHFRNALAEFTKAFQEGDRMNIEDMRLAVIDANQALKKIGPAKKITRWTTYLSLPLGILESFIGVPIFGLCMGVLGGCSQAILDYTKLKHEWVLFGRI